MFYFLLNPKNFRRTWLSDWSPYRSSLSYALSDNSTLLPPVFIISPKFNMVTNTYDIHDFGDNYEIGEVVFVPKNSGCKEDDGNLVLFAYDKIRDPSLSHHSH